MFDVGFYELVIVLGLAVLVLNKKDFVRGCYFLGKALGSLQKHINAVRQSFSALWSEVALEEISKEAQANAHAKEPVFSSHVKKPTPKKKKK